MGVINCFTLYKKLFTNYLWHINQQGLQRLCNTDINLFKKRYL